MLRVVSPAADVLPSRQVRQPEKRFVRDCYYDVSAAHPYQLAQRPVRVCQVLKDFETQHQFKPIVLVANATHVAGLESVGRQPCRRESHAGWVNIEAKDVAGHEIVQALQRLSLAATSVQHRSRLQLRHYLPEHAVEPIEKEPSERVPSLELGEVRSVRREFIRRDDPLTSVATGSGYSRPESSATRPRLCPCAVIISPISPVAASWTPTTIRSTPTMIAAMCSRNWSPKSFRTST